MTAFHWHLKYFVIRDSINSKRKIRQKKV